MTYSLRNLDALEAELPVHRFDAAHESAAVTVPEVITEMLLSNTSERQGRLIDKDEAGSMEKKKREGYF